MALGGRDETETVDSDADLDGARWGPVDRRAKCFRAPTCYGCGSKEASTGHSEES